MEEIYDESMANYYMSQQLHEDAVEDFKRKNSFIWRCKDGTKIKVSDMSNKHLINAINMINRTSADKKTLLILSEEMKRRGLKVPERNIFFDCDATIQDIY